MSVRVKFLLSLVAFTIVLRFMPYFVGPHDVKSDSGAHFYPWNFIPLTAVCLYSGAFITDRRLRFMLPLLALLVSDLGIWAIKGQFSGAFPSDRWSAYLCNVLAVTMGYGLNQKTGMSRAVNAVGRGVLAECLFFVVTNFAYFLVQTDFAHNAAGLMACYVEAIPYAGRSFVSTIFYSLLLFSPLAERAITDTKQSELVLQTVEAR